MRGCKGIPHKLMLQSYNPTKKSLYHPVKCRKHKNLSITKLAKTTHKQNLNPTHKTLNPYTLLKLQTSRSEDTTP